MLSVSAVEALLIAMRVIAGVVVLDVVLTWTLSPSSRLRRWTRQLTAPLYKPIQAVIDPARAGADFSPMIVVMALTTIAWLLAPDLVAGR